MTFPKYPYIPFPDPIPVPPRNRGDFCFTVDGKWLPYILGALFPLTASRTWETDDADIRREALDLLAQIASAKACQVPDNSGIEVDDCEMKFRMCGGKLQVCDCGTWVDIPSCDDNPGGFEPTQPGAGAPQPPAGGGKAYYCGALSGPSEYIIPTLMSSGDTLLFSLLAGAWHGSDDLFWFCPDGYVFVDGVCGDVPPRGSPDPVPGARHMSIIAYIDGTPYDVLGIDPSTQAPTTFTIPSGHTNAQVVLTGNIDDNAKIRGEVTFCVNVVNNAAARWTHEFDFVSSTGPWVPLSDSIVTDGAVWIPGTGWSYKDQILPGGAYERIVGIQLDPIIFSMDSIDFVYSRVLGTRDSTATSGQNLVLNTSVVDSVAWGALDAGTDLHYRYLTPTSITSRIAVQLGCANNNTGITFDGSVIITRAIVTGHGVNPFA